MFSNRNQWKRNCFDSGTKEDVNGKGGTERRSFVSIPTNQVAVLRVI